LGLLFDIPLKIRGIKGAMRIISPLKIETLSFYISLSISALSLDVPLKITVLSLLVSPLR